MKKNNMQSFNFRRGLLASAVMAGMSVSSVQAIEIDTGSEDLAVRFDNTFKYNYGVRTESADKTMLGTPNSNDGDYNFRKAGTNITNRVDILSELDVVYKESMGFRVSAAGWYDKAYENVGSNSNPYANTSNVPGLTNANTGLIPSGLAGINYVDATGFGKGNLSNYAQRYYTGPSGEILDAFVFYSTEVGDGSLLSAKAGQTNVFWGEALLNPIHSVSYGQSGLDLAKLASSPGTEAKELFVPRNQLFSSFTLNNEWTFAGQYFLDWDAARLPEAGTYYGGSDVLDRGGVTNLLGNSSAGLVQANALSNVTRSASDQDPSDSGDWGVMAKWSPEWLDGTLGAYYRNTSDILPQAYLDGRGLTISAATPGTGNPVYSGLGLLGQAGNLYNSLASANYGLAYADDIDIYGISLSKNIAGVSVGSDLNIRHNMPLASIPAALSAQCSPNTLTPGVCVPGLAGGLGFPPSLLPPRDLGTGVFVGNPDNNLAATGDTLHFVLNGLGTFADTPVFDSAVLIAEVSYSNLLSLNSDKDFLYKGQSTYRGIDAPTTANAVFGTVFTPTWYQVLPGVDFTAPVALSVGVLGVSPVQGGGAKDTGNYSLGIGAQIYNQYFVDLKYVDAFGQTDKCNDSPASSSASANTQGQGDGSTPNGLAGSQAYTCYEGGYSSFSGAGAAIEDRGAVYLTFKTTI